MDLVSMNKRNTFFYCNILISVLWLIQLIFENWVDIQLLKYEIVVLVVYSVISAAFVLKSNLHPYVVFLGTFSALLCSRVFFDIVGFESFALTTFFTTYEFYPLIQKKILLMLGISLAFLNLGSSVSNIFNVENVLLKLTFNQKLFDFSILLMKISFIPAIFAYFQIINQAWEYGYVYIYTESFQRPALLRFFTIFQIGYYLLLASLPEKKVLMKYTFCYCFFLVMSLCIGGRAQFACGILTILIYYNYYVNKIKLRKILVIFLSLIFIFQFVLWFREASDQDHYTFDSNIMAVFFYQQGGSLEVLGYTEQFKDELSVSGMNNIFYPFTRYFDEIFNKDQINMDFNRDTIFYYKLSYLANSQMYYMGLGTGSSFIGEIYAAGGFFFLIICCFLLGAFINYSFVKFRNYHLGLAFLFYFWSGLFFMPRSSFLGNSIEIIKGFLFIIIFYPMYKKTRNIKW